MRTQTCMQTHKYDTYANINTHAHMHKYTPAHTHMHTHTHPPTCTHTPPDRQALFRQKVVQELGSHRVFLSDTLTHLLDDDMGMDMLGEEHILQVNGRGRRCAELVFIYKH